MQKKILLQQIGNMDHGILLDLKNDLRNYFKEYSISVDSSDISISLNEFSHDSTEMKYSGSEILKRIIKYHEKSKYLSILGLIDEDIKSLKRKYVFGIAKSTNQLILMANERFKKPESALVSIYRLRESFYSRPEKRNIFKERILKTSIHELGHSFGLKSCNHECIMQCKRTITEVDKKSIEFCNECKKYLHHLFIDLG